MSQRVASRRDSVCTSLDEKHKAKEAKEKAQSQTESDKQKKNERDKNSLQFEKDFGKFKSEIKDLFHEFDERIDKKLSKLDDKFSSIFEQLKQEVGNLKSEVRETKEEVTCINSKVTELEKSIEFQAEKQDDFADLQGDRFGKVNQQLKELDKKIMLLEKYDRKYNLLFYGIPEESKENMKSKMKTYFQDTLKIAEDRLESMQFMHCHRIPSEGNGPNPVIVRFLSFEDRELIYSKQLLPVLRQKRQRILTDLPAEMKRTRAILAREAYKIRKEEGLKTRIKEKGLSVYLEVRESAVHRWEKRDL